eukprot:scaffold225_cov388-Prasinococcus_capsulatus_cf.AAC.48
MRKNPCSPQYVPQLLRPIQNSWPVALSTPQPTRDSSWLGRGKSTRCSKMPPEYCRNCSVTWMPHEIGPPRTGCPPCPPQHRPRRGRTRLRSTDGSWRRACKCLRGIGAAAAAVVVIGSRRRRRRRESERRALTGQKGLRRGARRAGLADAEGLADAVDGLVVLAGLVGQAVRRNVLVRRCRVAPFAAAAALAVKQHLRRARRGERPDQRPVRAACLSLVGPPARPSHARGAHLRGEDDLGVGAGALDLEPVAQSAGRTKRPARAAVPAPATTGASSRSCASRPWRSRRGARSHCGHDHGRVRTAGCAGCVSP